MDPVVLWILAGLLVVVGIAGTFLPALPGAPLVFGGLFIAAWADGFQRIGWPSLTILGVLALVTVAIDFFASALGAKKMGASKQAILGSVIGTFAGIWMGLPWLIVGPFVGAALGEYIAKENWEQARKVGIATWLGMLVGAIAKIALVFAMVGVFITAFFI